MNELPLDQLANGQAGVVHRVLLDGRTKRRLIEMGVTPGTTVRVIKRAPLGDPIEVVLRGYSLTLRRDDANKITVRSAVGA